MFSDSQISTDTTETHGRQKQFVGRDFLLGASGNMLLIKAVFASLIEPGTGDCCVDHKGIESHLQDFLQSKVTERARSSVSLLIVRPCKTEGHRIDLYQPDLFRFFTPQGNYSALGSGSKVVLPTIERDSDLGLFSQPSELMDMLVSSENYLEAAARSLTVNSQFIVGLLHSDRAYLMRDLQISASFAPSALRSRWQEVAAKYQRIIDLARLIRGEIREAQRVLSKIHRASLQEGDFRAIEGHQMSVKSNRELLQSELMQYFNWYDGVLQR